MQSNASRIHVGVACNRAFFPGLLVTFGSALFHLRAGLPSVWHIVDGGLTSDQWRALHVLASRLGRDVDLRKVAPDFRRLAGARTMCGNHLTYARLLLADSVEADRLVYVDSDFLVLRDLVELWEQPLSAGEVVAASPDQTIRILRNDWSWEDMPSVGLDAPYFNAGIVCFDLRSWRSLHLGDKVLDLVTRCPEKCRCWDQSAMNKALAGQVRFLPPAWNSFAGVFRPESLASGHALNLHFAAHPKPWGTYSTLPAYRLWYLFHDLVCSRVPAVVKYHLEVTWLARMMKKCFRRLLAEPRRLIPWGRSPIGPDQDEHAVQAVLEAGLRRLWSTH